MGINHWTFQYPHALDSKLDTHGGVPLRRLKFRRGFNEGHPGDSPVLMKFVIVGSLVAFPWFLALIQILVYCFCPLKNDRNSGNLFPSNTTLVVTIVYWKYGMPEAQPEYSSYFRKRNGHSIPPRVEFHIGQ